LNEAGVGWLKAIEKAGFLPASARQMNGKHPWTPLVKAGLVYQTEERISGKVRKVYRLTDYGALMLSPEEIPF
jgi:hypothetical protein